MREFGISAEPVIDWIRPKVQKLWLGLTPGERKTFMSRLRHLWGVARHRLPMHIHDQIQHLRIEGRLKIFAGKVIDIRESDEHSIEVIYYNKRTRMNEQLFACRVINCSGPETDLSKVEENFLTKCLNNGMISQDDLKLGLNANPISYRLIDRKGEPVKNLFTIGSNLKGILWESTAVHELREQAERLAKNILEIDQVVPYATS